jgi:RimJ/RimL family protein N-acetyltransferase
MRVAIGRRFYQTGYDEGPVTVRHLRADANPLIDRLTELYEFKPYRSYRIWSRRQQRAMLRAEIDRAMSMPGCCDAVAGDGDGSVIGIAVPLPWDTGFFGVAMARLNLLLRGPQASRADIRQVVQSLIDQCREGGITHVTARVDVGDMVAVAVLEDAGFRLMDALVTYFTHPRRDPPAPVREVGRVRSFVPSDTASVLAITREAYQGFRGRFHLDPHLSRARSDEFYLEWAAQCCAGTMADRVVVADDGAGGLHGWASARRVEPSSTVGGIGLWAGSLGACRRDRPGAYAGLIRAIAMENYQAGEVTETQTQNHNIATIRVYDAVGARYVRADYTFHAWLR